MSESAPRPKTLGDALARASKHQAAGPPEPMLTETLKFWQRTADVYAKLNASLMKEV